ncbi:VOC family protein [Streptomyces hoynatensis]|uniref:Glyoxalase/bleomycin resistance/extradiol dioxygenase family protein n=1 Tax=Streptomyces hoynatensis TaxID=1141874 RepID=A0A3A9ZIX5_9ACTN|nr:VOC family protein [Streptomyces hoynatensis]RKN47166.1 glyoxalase/bleomycin resistance/extradiol dioxygenase family protein [Streptomyces hoynatensis]
MDALHPRLLVDRFPETFRFYDAVLPALLGAARARGDAAGPYASWDVGGEGVLALFDRAAAPPELAGAQAAAPGTMLVSRVEDVDAAFALCTAHGAAPVAGPTARPAWGPTMRTAHVRAPEGTLWELQAY